MRAEATVGQVGANQRVILRTYASYGEFEYVLARCKRVLGGRFRDDNGDKHWHYPLSLETCKALREAWGADLAVGTDLAVWYRQAADVAHAQAQLGAENDVPLDHVPAAFAEWLRPYQRVGAKWIARGYRDAGIIADVPGLGKTTELLAALLEGQFTGPVLIVCPKASVKPVWEYEIKKHLPDVPVYACYGTRERRTKVLEQFRNDVQEDKSDTLRIVVIVAEMLRVEMGDPCYTEGGNKVAGMCPQVLKSTDGMCRLHKQRPALKKKDEVPVGFSYPVLFGLEWSVVAIDESHKLMGSLSVVKGNLMARGLKLLRYRPGHRRYALSGTPFGKGGRAEGMFGTLHWLWPDEYTSFWKWASGPFNVEQVVTNRRTGATVNKVRGLKGLSLNATAEEEAKALETFLESLGPRILRRTKSECLPWLPAKDIRQIVCEMTPRQHKQHEELIKFAEITTPNGVISPNGHLAMLMRSRQLANGAISKRTNGKVYFLNESGKLERLWQELEERGILDEQPGPKLIIASGFNEFLDTISWRLREEKVRFFRIDGSTTEAQRGKLMTAWQGKDPCRVMLLNTKAGGVSITLDAADEMHIMDEDPDPGVNEQLEDRIHRASRIHQVTIFYYRTEGTIDFVKAESVDFRRRVQHLLLDEKRGVEYTRNFMKEALEQAT